MLDSEGRVGYVLLSTRATHNYVWQMRSKLGEFGIRGDAGDIEQHALLVPKAHRDTEKRTEADGSGKSSGGGPCRLLPCLVWFDSSHICLTDYYRSFVFSQVAARDSQREMKMTARSSTTPPTFCPLTLPTTCRPSSPQETPLLTKGTFIEAELGPTQFADFVAHGVGEALPRWRTCAGLRTEPSLS